MECYLSIDAKNIDTVCDGQDVQSLTPLNANTKFDVTYNHIPFELGSTNDINTYSNNNNNNNINDNNDRMNNDIESVSTSTTATATSNKNNNNGSSNNKRRSKKRKNNKHSICIDMSIDKSLPDIPETKHNNNNNNNNNNNDRNDKCKHKNNNMSFELKNCSFNYGVFTTMMPLTYYNVSNIIPNNCNIKKRPKYKLTRKVNKIQNKKYILCEDFVKIGVCYLGNKCKYSHNIYHNSKKKRVTNYKCSPCVEPARGIKCQYGNKCNFTHPGQELRRPMPIAYQDKLYYSLLLRDQQIYRYPFGIFM